MSSSSVVVLRTNPNKAKTAFHLDIAKVTGMLSDSPVQASDVVFLQKSALGAVPYSFHALFQRFGTDVFLFF
jgi:hypothetical protein